MCFSLNIIRVIKSRKIRYKEHVEHMRWMRNTDKILVIINKADGRPRYKWEVNIKIYLQEEKLECSLDSAGSRPGPIVGTYKIIH